MVVLMAVSAACYLDLLSALLKWVFCSWIRLSLCRHISLTGEWSAANVDLQAGAGTIWCWLPGVCQAHCLRMHTNVAHCVICICYASMYSGCIS
jgi:hypothetical protein